MANSVDVVEVALYEPPHQDLHCLPIQPFSSLVHKELSEESAQSVLLCRTWVFNMKILEL